LQLNRGSPEGGEEKAHQKNPAQRGVKKVCTTLVGGKLESLKKRCLEMNEKKNKKRLRSGLMGKSLKMPQKKKGGRSNHVVSRAIGPGVVEGIRETVKGDSEHRVSGIKSRRGGEKQEHMAQQPLIPR